MNYSDRARIDFLCENLILNVDLAKLWPRLVENQVFNRDDVNVPNWTRNLSDPQTKRDVCDTIKTRGPYAFKGLLRSLRQSEHRDVADKLDGGRRSSSRNKPPTPLTSCTDTSDDESIEDDYHTRVMRYDKPLVIKVKKAKKFRDGPEFTDIERYVMRSYPRGLILIITNIKYQLSDDRPSAQHDEANLTKLYEEMGFKVISHFDLTGAEMRKKIFEFSRRKDLKHVDSAFVIISAHGNGDWSKQETEIQGIDYKMPNYEKIICMDILNYFTSENCSHLQGKPKVFMFQTCRGEKDQKAISRTERDVVTCRETKNEPTDDGYRQTMRNCEDMIVAYATIPGHVSYRDKYNGSWFIQILCEVFMNHAHKKHLVDLLMMTDSRLKNLRTEKNNCQTVVTISKGFSKHCYLNPGLFANKES